MELTVKTKIRKKNAYRGGVVSALILLAALFLEISGIDDAHRKPPENCFPRLPAQKFTRNSGSRFSFIIIQIVLTILYFKFNLTPIKMYVFLVLNKYLSFKNKKENAPPKKVFIIKK